MTLLGPYIVYAVVSYVSAGILFVIFAIQILYQFSWRLIAIARREKRTNISNYYVRNKIQQKNVTLCLLWRREQTQNHHHKPKYHKDTLLRYQGS